MIAHRSRQTDPVSMGIVAKLGVFGADWQTFESLVEAVELAGSVAVAIVVAGALDAGSRGVHGTGNPCARGPRSAQCT